MKVSKCLNTDVSPQHQRSLAVCLDALHMLLQLKPVITITPTVMLNIVLIPTDNLKAKAVSGLEAGRCLGAGAPGLNDAHVFVNCRSGLFMT